MLSAKDKGLEICCQPKIGVKNMLSAKDRGLEYVVSQR